MTLPLLAPVSELEKRLGVEIGSLAGTDLVRAETDLTDASALVRGLVRPLGVSWVSADGLVSTAPDEVVAIVARAAKRSYLNPDLLASESIGGKYSYQRDQNSTTIALSADEAETVLRAARDELGGSSPTGWKGVGTIRTPSAYRRGPAYDWRDGLLPGVRPLS